MSCYRERLGSGLEWGLGTDLGPEQAAQGSVPTAPFLFGVLSRWLWQRQARSPPSVRHASSVGGGLGRGREVWACWRLF